MSLFWEDWADVIIYNDENYCNNRAIYKNLEKYQQIEAGVRIPDVKILLKLPFGALKTVEPIYLT